MSNDRFVAAQRGYMAWGIIQADGRRHAHYCGDVIAWHMDADDERQGDARQRFVARPVLLTEAPEGVVVAYNGRLYGKWREWCDFESWLRSEGLVVAVHDADLARRLYGIGDELIESRDRVPRSKASGAAGGDTLQALSAALSTCSGFADRISCAIQTRVCSGLVADALNEVAVTEMVSLSARAALNDRAALP
ncbi:MULTISPECIES: hypothetical protein [Burkholderia cepacia complex]|uniref:hypothetical protein n=1 Tax=Burkholderia cepacia complex TaxID=87882 RepID=UPI000A530311|nr:MULTISPECIES: hypothetical protein [Burkholderia cepacia complex]MBR8301401.1 hypothetical protein [Burkholderia dolosa]MBR8316673.1 hypothetical protein [Burkholderia dolosa]